MQVHLTAEHQSVIDSSERDGLRGALIRSLNLCNGAPHVMSLERFHRHFKPLLKRKILSEIAYAHVLDASRKASLEGMLQIGEEERYVANHYKDVKQAFAMMLE